MWTDRKRFVVAAAGRRSGKTHIAAMHVLRSCLVRKPWSDSLYLLAAPTQPQARTIWWDRIKKIIPRKFIRGEPQIRGWRSACAGVP